MASLRIPRGFVQVFTEFVRVLRDPALLVWSLFILAIPFYVFDSGLPQPGDGLMVVLIPIVLLSWNRRLDANCARPLRALMLFTTWALLVNWGWALILGEYGLFGRETFFVFPLYYVYNTFVFLVFCILYQRDGARFLWLTLHLVFIAVVMQVAFSFFVHRSHNFRGIGFFNNPNQLGFYALLSACIIALGRRRLGFGTIKAGIGMTSCIYLAVVSASKAAVVGAAILIALTIITNPRLIIASSVLVVAALSIGGPISDAIDGTQRRLVEDRFPQFSFFQQRGYDRITAHEEYWLLGAGEGGTDRFEETTVIGTHEIHSSAGTIFFSYGVVGIVLFGVFLWRVIRGAPLRSMLMLLPPLAYTIAHQGLRAQLLWILFAMFVALKHLQQVSRASP